MTDDTILNQNTTSGDKYRGLDRLSAGVKTQVVQLDVGGSASNAESLVSLANGLPVKPATGATFAVTGTFYQTTQPVSWSGQSVSITGNITLGSGANVIGSISNTSFGISGTLPSFAATPTFNLGTLNGAATDAHLTNVQSAPGTPQTTALTIQGNASGVAVPVSGAVTANAGTNLNTSALALESGGNLAAMATATGTQSDAAWTSGSGSVIALLKKIASAGGSAVSVADGSDVTQGSQADAAWSGTGSGSVVAILKSLYSKLAGTLGVITSDATGTVSGSAAGVLGSAFSANGYASITFQLTSVGVGGTMYLEGSWDGGTTWTFIQNTALNALANPTAANFGLAVGNTVIAATVAPLLRFRLNTYTSGTFTVAYRLSVTPPPLANITNATVATILRTQVNTGLTGRSAVISAATTNATLVITGQHQVYSTILSNNSASWAYFKLFNKATAPVPGTDTPVEVYGIPPNASIMISTADIGDYFTLGVGYAITGAPALNDTTALAAANTIVGTILYV